MTWIVSALIGFIAGAFWDTWLQLFVGAVGFGMMLGGYAAIRGVPWSADDEREAFGSPQHFSKTQIFFFQLILTSFIYFICGTVVFGIRA